MNTPDQSLDRLLRAASRVAPEPVLPLPFPAEARVLAAWRRSRGDRLQAGLGIWLRAGFAGAVVVAMIAVAVSWSEIRVRAVDEFAVADATLYVAVAP